MGIRELAERHWNGEGDLAVAEHPVAPAGSRQGEEIDPGVLYMKSLASVTAIDTGEGLVLLDTGGVFDREAVYEAVRRWRPSGRVAAAVFSHHHVDHVFGTARFDEEALRRGWPRPTVYGHAGIPGHFVRYRRTAGWNAAINRRQFGLDERFQWPLDYRLPDVTYEERLTFRQGRLTFELHHGRGETDDATWTWVPELRLLHPGDLFIWALPNAGNPQKVQRYLSDWAEALRQMAALGAETMVPGHGLPVFGSSRIAEALLATAEVLDSFEEQALALMNEARTLDEVIHGVEMPAHLATKPYLRPVYDHHQFLVRSVWRRYGGWYDGEPDNLLPAPRAEQAAEWVSLAGGVRAVVERARQLAAERNERLACHLLELAVLAEPSSREAHEARAEVYAARASREESSMARNIFDHASRSSLLLRRDLASPR